MTIADRIRKLPPAAIVAIILSVICGISLYIRIALPYDQVFVDGAVLFKGVDPWYHMRLIDNLVHHFPQRIYFDPYSLYPAGDTVGMPPFLDWLVGGVARIVSWGLPSQHTLDAVGAYAPAILGTLIAIPVYFIGKELFNRWVGLLSAALVVILPGELLNRSLLGFTDHHVAESLFATTAVLFFILAVKRAREREISFGHLRSRDWAVITKPLIYTVLAGIFLGIYVLTWIGALLIVFIIFAYLVIQFIIDHLRHRSTDYLCIISVPAFLLSFIMALPYLTSRGAVYIVPMLVAILAPVALSAISRLMARKGIRPAYYPLALVVLAGAGFAVFYAIDPSLIQTMLSKFSIFAPAGAKLTIIEVHPLLRPFGTEFSLQIAWANFTTSFFISFISLVWLIYGATRKESADRTLFLVWSVIMLLAVLGQRRFSYYFAINAALLTGYFCWRVLDFAALRELLAAPREAATKVVKRVKKKKRKVKAAQKTQKTVMRPTASWIKLAIAAVAIFFLVFFPNIGPAKALAQSPPLISEGWYSATAWLKENSPEPFTDPDFYYELYETPFQYPDTAYGVVSWWDYGHWITRIGRRIPNTSPAGQRYAPQVASFFIAQDEASASQMMDDVLGSKYVMIDNAMPTGKFYAMPQWAGHSEDEFFETYYVEAEAGNLQPVNLFYPAYYHSMVVRLYNFDGQAVVPQETLVITYEERTSSEGVPYKEIIDTKSFTSYEDAASYVASQATENCRIVGVDVLRSPVPLEELSDYELVYQSPATAKVGDKRLPEVKIFEYVQSSGP